MKTQFPTLWSSLILALKIRLADYPSRVALRSYGQIGDGNMLQKRHTPRRSTAVDQFRAWLFGGMLKPEGRVHQIRHTAATTVATDMLRFEALWSLLWRRIHGYNRNPVVGHPDIA